MRVRLTGAMSMRQNDFGGTSRASRIAARITAGCVTATVATALSVNDLATRPPVRSGRRSTHRRVAPEPDRSAKSRGPRGRTSFSVFPCHCPQSRSANSGSGVACKPSNCAVWRARCSGPASWRATAWISRSAPTSTCRRPMSLSGSSPGKRPAAIASVIAWDTKVSLTTSVTPRYSMPVRSRLASRAAARQARQRPGRWSPTAPAA